MPGEAEGGPERFRAALVSCHRQLRETRDQRPETRENQLRGDVGTVAVTVERPGLRPSSCGQTEREGEVMGSTRNVYC